MATEKKSFLLYADVLHTVRHLNNEQAGELFKHILAYVNDEQPETENPIIKIAFEPIKQSLKRDLRKYETIKEKRSLAGQASAEARAVKAKKKESKATKSTSVESAEQSSTNPTVSVSVSESVSDSDNILSEYREKDFLEDWKKCRKEYKNLPTHIPKLQIQDHIKFTRISNELSKDQIREAMVGLFRQEVIGFNAMITQPTHFLENVDKYYNAFLSNDFKQYGSKPIVIQH